MRLSTQLSSSLAIFLLMVFAGSFLINVNLTKEYVSEQLATHAQDTGTSLGLSITPYLGDSSQLIVAETMVNAIFDRGFYQYITVTDIDGNVLIERRNPSTQDTVPSWFSDVVNIIPPTQQTELNNGWTLAGTLTVQSHPGLANETLYENVKHSAFMFFTAFVFAYIVLLFIINTITKPLRVVVNKINEIQDQKFSQINYKPFTQELTFITKAVNSLSSSLESMFGELIQKAEHFKTKAYEDDLTGLQNRSAFTQQMSAMLSATANTEEGYLFIVRLAHLNAINTSIGAQAGDEYINTVVNELTLFCDGAAQDMSLFRLSGSDFAIISETFSSRDCLDDVNTLSQKLAKSSPLKDISKPVWISVTHFNDDQSFSEIMEKADSALMVASKQPFAVQFASELVHVHSSTVWRDRLNDVISARSADIYIQPIMNTKNEEPLYFEAFARFKDKESGSVIPMSQLIPASERLNLIPEVDKLVITLILEKLAVSKTDIAINIASASLASAQFRQWLVQKMEQYSELCNKVIFEIENTVLIQHKADTVILCKTLKEFGCRITIEHFGEHLASLSGLRAVQPDFVKVSGKLTKGIDTDQDSQLFIGSLLSIARGLGINVIAELVESEAESKALSQLNVLHQQGFYFAKPTIWHG